MLGASSTTAGMREETSASVSRAATEQRGEQNGSDLRCWQEGQLLFEETNWLISIESQEGVVLKGIKQRPDPRRKLSVMRFGTAVCLLVE